MSTSVASVVSHFPSAENGFTTTTSGSVSSGAVTVGLNSVAGYSNGEVVVFVIDPTDASKKQTFTGIMDTGGSQVTSVIWTAGTNQTHSAGATVVDYATATHISMVTKGLLVEHDQDGTHGAVTASSIVVTGDVTAANFIQSGGAGADGWTAGLPAPNTITAQGNRSYDVVFSNTDVTDTLSPGMRLRTTRTVAAPTQCTDLESGSSQYYSKTSPAGMTFTDEFTCMAWIKAESYTGGGIIARRNADTEGWSFAMNSNGTIELSGLRIAGNNVTLTSYQSVPLSKWVHVAATLDMSANTGTMYIDGVLVPSVIAVTGTATALVQGTTALVVGAYKSAGTAPFDGKIAQAAVFSDDLSAATIRSYMSQTLTGSETSLVSAYSFNNSILDLSSNDNDLSAQGSAVATATDTPFTNPVTNTSVTAGTTNYGIVTAASFSTHTTVTVQVPEGCTIPTTGGVSAVSYSSLKIPYAFPGARGKWTVESHYKTSLAGSTTTNTYGQFVGAELKVPVGDWMLGYDVNASSSKTAASQIAADVALSTSTSSASDAELHSTYGGNDFFVARARLFVSRYKTISAQTPYYLIGKLQQATINGNAISGESNPSFLTAECAYL